MIVHRPLTLSIYRVPEERRHVPAQPILDPRAPVFFMSYSGAVVPDAIPDPANSHVQRFFGDVSALVNEFLALSMGHVPGFLDAQIQGGQFWERKILEAVGRCQVFVPLLSPRFMASDWCRFEWATFACREIRLRDKEDEDVESSESVADAAIVPVNWTLMDPAQSPPTIRKIQTFAPRATDGDARAAYLDEGVLGLLAMNRENAYRVVVHRLARRIVDIVEKYEVVPQVPPDTSGLGPTFMEEI
jgi:hypothetical protein